MKRTEAIEWLKNIKEKYIHGGDDFYDYQRRTAIDYAMSVLENIEQKPKTNAERIRAMSDEELAHFMVERNVNESTLQLFDKDYELTAVQIEALKQRLYCACMQWLQQPAKENDHA